MVSDYLAGLDKSNDSVTASQIDKELISKTSSLVQNKEVSEYPITPPEVTSSNIEEIHDVDRKTAELNVVQYLKSQSVSVRRYVLKK